MPLEIPESSTMAENSRYRKLKNHNQLISESDPNSSSIPSITPSTRSKSTISSILLSPFSPTTTTDHSTTTTVASTPKRKNFTSVKFRGMGCTASSQVSVPAVIRTSASWEAKKMKKKILRSKKNQSPISPFCSSIACSSASTINNPSSSSTSSSDVWCGPGSEFTSDSSSVDRAVSKRPVSGKAKFDHRERSSYSARRMVNLDNIPSMDSNSTLGMHRSLLDLSRSRHHSHGRHESSEGIAEIVRLQSRLIIMGERFSDWRLDIDNMSYEELLELSDRIGYVSTGLKEDEIARCLGKIVITSEMERKCSICQEEYEANDETGKLNCGHVYHIACVKQWLLQKNWCPVCKTSVKACS